MRKILRLWPIAVWPVLLFNLSPLTAGPAVKTVDYEWPTLLIGKIYPMKGDSKQMLFKSERKAVRQGSKIEASCDYTYPDGAVAVRDRIVYEGSRLISYEEEQLQIGEKGKAVIRRDASEPGKGKIEFEYVTGFPGQPKKSTATENLQPDTLIDDMIPAFIETHWDTLDQGQPARFRYIVLSRKETVGFKLTKESESTRQGKPVMRIKMEPTSFIIAQLVDPLIFVVEKGGRHRILEYIGRTTPMVKSGSKWKDLDGISVYDWD